jgi:hypothetical protein
MVRHYQSKKAIFNKAALAKAIRLVKDKGVSIRNAAKRYRLSKSAIGRHIKGAVKARGGQPVLSKDFEDYLVGRILICAEWGYPLDYLDLRMFVKWYHDKKGMRIKKFRNNLPGEDWAKSFLKRHSDLLSERLTQNVKRARAAVSPIVINSYFDNLEKTLTGVPPENIVNYDETNFSDEPGRSKCLVKRGVKYCERNINHSKSATSVMFAAAANGTVLPPYVVYKSVHLYDTWTEGGPPGTRYNRTKSGWFDRGCFEDWFDKIAFPYLKRLNGKKSYLVTISPAI